MTLISAFASGKGFVGISGDRRVTQYETDGSYTIVKGLGNTKVERITKYVLLGSSGSVVLGNHIKRCFKGVAEEEFDLDNCKVILQEIVDQLVSTPRYNEMVARDTHRVGVYLVGFYSDGSTGMITLDTAQGTKIQTEKLTGTETTGACALPFEHECIEPITGLYLNTTEEEDEKITLLDVNVRFMEIQRYISYFCDRVSCDYDYLALYKDENGHIKFDQRYLDVSYSHAKLPQHGDLQYELDMRFLNRMKETRIN